jgi:hypothetical protein
MTSTSTFSAPARPTANACFSKPTASAARRLRRAVLEGRHGIRRQQEVTFKTFAATYLTDHAEMHKHSVYREREIIKVLNRSLAR